MINNHNNNNDDDDDDNDDDDDDEYDDDDYYYYYHYFDYYHGYLHYLFDPKRKNYIYIYHDNSHMDSYIIPTNHNRS